MKSHPRGVALRSRSQVKQWHELSGAGDSRWPLWAQILIWVPCFTGVILIGTTLPFSTSHWKVVGSIFLWSVHAWVLLDSLVTGVFKSKQGNYDRAEMPIRFWMVCIFMGVIQGVMAVVMIATWYEI